MNFEEVNLIGGGGNDTLRGGRGDDDLIGNSGDDFLSGNDGNDRLDGGAGNDDLILGRGVDWADGGAGDDFGDLDRGNSNLSFLIDERAIATSAGQLLVDGTYVRNIERWDLFLGNGNDTVITDIRTGRFIQFGGGDNSLIIDHRGQSTSLIGVAGDTGISEYLVSVGTDFGAALDSLRAWFTGHVSIYGGTGNDTIAGLVGTDVLDGGAGADTMAGGGGDDSYVVDNLQDQVIELAGGGRDTVYTSISYALAAASEVEVLTTTDSNATAAITLVGNGIAQYIYGNAGSNGFDGGGGGDVMVGLGGDDRYFARAGDRVVEAVGGGLDRVYAFASFTLEAGSEIEILSTVDNLATAAVTLVGNGIAQYLYGNAGSNGFDGGGGGDVMVGLEGDDRYFARAGDRVVEAAGGGFDRVYAFASFTLNAGSEIEILSTVDNLATAAVTLVGNGVAQYIYGNAGSNGFDGGGGGDVMVGLEGDDRYFVRAGDRVVEAAGGGSDRVYAFASFTLEAGSEIEILSTVDNLATAAVTLVGNGFAQYVYGNAGSNIIDGKGGADILIGLAGADSFAFTSALGGSNVDRIVDFKAGEDRIQLDDAVFTGLALGALDPNAFVIGAHAADSDDRIVYDSATGQLFFDADGNGAGAAVQFATVSAGLALTASDFAVI